MPTASRAPTGVPARHWWSVQPRSADLAPISASRAYAEVLVIFGVFFAASVAAAGFSVSYPSLTLNLFHSAQAGFLEEAVVLAFVVTTLERARRPLPETVVVALVLRASYHIYYGPGVVGIVVWASAFLWRRSQCRHRRSHPAWLLRSVGAGWTRSTNPPRVEAKIGAGRLRCLRTTGGPAGRIRVCC